MESAVATFVKQTDRMFTTGNGVYRIGDESGILAAYLVETSIGLIQINTVPELFKTYFPVLKKLPTAIFASAPVTNQLGDSYTGFEFELWVSRFMDFMNPNRIKFISTEENLRNIYNRLEIPMNGDFIKDDLGTEQAKFVGKRWVDDVFEWCPIKNEFGINNVKFQYLNDHHLVIYDKKKLVFDSELYPNYSANGKSHDYVNEALKRAPEFAANPDELGLIIAGTSIGTRPGVTSNFIFHWNDRVLWMDPPARAFEKGLMLGLNIDRVDDFLISHVHEDHIEGFSGILKRKIENRQKLNLLTTPKVLQQLKTIFSPNFGDFSDHINYVNVHDAKFQNYHGASFQVRTNYHPVSTIGLKVSFNGKTIGVSGDILYKDSILKSRLQTGSISKEEFEQLRPEWFRDCQVLLHDTTVSGDPVHTALKDVEALATKLSASTKILGYHAGAPIESKIVQQANFGDKF